MGDHLWLTSAEHYSHLAISSSTLFAIRRSGLLKDGRHLVAKTPTSARSGGSADGCQQIKRQRGALKPQDPSGDPDHQPAGILCKKR